MVAFHLEFFFLSQSLREFEHIDNMVSNEEYNNRCESISVNN